MLVKFFLTCNKIGAFTLGGGYAMIPIMEQEFVDKNKWMDKQEFMDIMVVAQTTPGIFAIDMVPTFCFRRACGYNCYWNLRSNGAKAPRQAPSLRSIPNNPREHRPLHRLSRPSW